jgi:MFS family permease
MTPGYRVYGYRWVVLAAFMAVNFTIQMLWIGYAPIIGEAAHFYAVSHLLIGLLAMVFMITFIPMSLPASWLIDTRGFRRAVGLGSVLMGLFGLARGLVGANYLLALVCTVGIAAGQPFLLNAWTKVPANWFPENQRATAVGLVILANLVGTAAGMVLAPVLVESMSISAVQLIFGAAAALCAVAFVAVARERPPTPPGPPGAEVRALMLDGLKHALTVKPFLVYMGVWFVGMGIFNGLMTWVGDILEPRGFTANDAGVLGALLLMGGVLGAVTIAPISDRHRKRVRYMVLGLTLAIPALVGVTFASTTWVLFASGFVFGFFLVSVSPVGMQYAAEVTHPTPEGTSNGLIQICGQASVVFVYLMSGLKTGSGSFTPSLVLAMALLGLSALLVARLRDPDPRSPTESPPQSQGPSQSRALVHASAGRPGID